MLNWSESCWPPEVVRTSLVWSSSRSLHTLFTALVSLENMWIYMILLKYIGGRSRGTATEKRKQWWVRWCCASLKLHCLHFMISCKQIKDFPTSSKKVKTGRNLLQIKTFTEAGCCRSLNATGRLIGWFVDWLVGWLLISHVLLWQDSSSFSLVCFSTFRIFCFVSDLVNLVGSSCGSLVLLLINCCWVLFGQALFLFLSLYHWWTQEVVGRTKSCWNLR